ncbi:MAG: sulfite exporter TauE/SafE family protein [Lautropia sp.]|nr:sulfite exporter TauE/SafE family protein [Lautropia sp.]
MEVSTILMLLAMGAGAGILAGLLGIGGGMVMVPFLVMIFDREGYEPARVVQMALATSLTTILFTSISSVRAHHRRGAVQWRLVRSLAPGIVLGSLLGARMVGYMPGQLLAGIFGGFIGWTAYRMFRGDRQAECGVRGSLPGSAGLMAAGGMIGMLSALLGAGGGFITVPYLANRGVSFTQAIATSAACGFPIALAGSLGYLLVGWWQGIPNGGFAYINLQALLTIVPMSMSFAPVGASLAHRLPVAHLKRAFSLLLFSLAGYMLYRALAPAFLRMF